MPRLTQRAFADLAILMVGFGFLMGVIFPPFVVVLGMPTSNAFSPLFAGACIGAGLCVGGINWLLAHRIVGQRLQVLSSRMDQVSLEVDKVSQADEWWHADPARWRLEVDSKDIFGTTAIAFDRLIEVLARSLRYQNAGQSFAEILVTSWTVDDLARSALDCLLLETHADGGAIVVRGKSGARPVAMRGLVANELVDRCEVVKEALASAQPMSKAGNQISIQLADPRARIHEVYATPFLYGGEVRGVILLAASEPLGGYARSVAQLFARDFGLAVANLEDRANRSVVSAAF